MTRRREVVSRLHGLAEVREIINAMKTLSFIETRRIGARLENEQGVIESIEAAAADFLAAHPDLDTGAADMPVLWIAIGSERGFCGDFNERVAERLRADIVAQGGGAPPVLLVGTRLASRLEGDPRVVAALPGAGVADEVDGTLARIVQTLGSERRQRGPVRVRAVFYDHAGGAPRAVSLLPPFRDLPKARHDGRMPPRIHLAPDALLLALADQYLSAALRRLLDTASMAEHQRRVEHLEGALRHLDDRVAALDRRRNQLRQEEIIEEIEVILLSAGSGGEWTPAGSADST